MSPHRAATAIEQEADVPPWRMAHCACALIAYTWECRLPTGVTASTNRAPQPDPTPAGE
jgi:hypothetical protein